MRIRKRHAWTAVLIGTFALPVLQPQGFPSLEAPVDALLGWPSRFELANPHAWNAGSDRGGGADGERARALETIAISEREEHFRLLDELAQRAQLGELLQGFQRLPLARPARILRAHDPSSTRRSLLLDRGSEDGLEVGQAVVQGRVFVGTVASVSAHTARVQLLTDPYARFEVAIRTSDGTRATAFVRGGAGDTLPLRNLRGAAGLHVRPGDPVLTSNADERVPAGLVVGYVVAAADDDLDAISDVRVRPSVDLERSTTVLVLVPGT
ncbi:MAG: rod shape-determining protein MreC [Planctomycetes bacterium]|nr:rod shape-determining protein MreC [Planctomycetota bacterium]